MLTTRLFSNSTACPPLNVHSKTYVQQYVSKTNIKPNHFSFLEHSILQYALIIVAQAQNLGVTLESSLFVALIPSINKFCCSPFKINVVSDQVSYEAEPHLSNLLWMTILGVTLVEFTSMSFVFRNKLWQMQWLN